ncbi:UDP-N-acetylmuramoyl-L-alanyl-D-glutamate-2, 6-diaminopimelate ligase [Propionispora sp. 2/2-37]|uniref:UDP-N-acetylmuramoyl-L-alanyl-D-glutamate--2, 6-diaminopimelate ligase n=1 Tax=Propionispora sp. 2/2-37 TaxID=1677858 RepID=UPI0006BB5FD3|nr:UDP-N-acetylmuramoyl-L-alanyl-D-glutamate--2,6-diaminopimelate ligase [Propionispora sp. 2/2-37]CUH94031.1 UDP-N-acetylmuramoyl-L-alanyl-D-glutamate-2, 6-diaminopimelate ligase [Propionispora sp. 2/2-37]
MTLDEIVGLLPDAVVDGEKLQTIRNIVCDSRQVTEGTLFICLPGVKTDGHDYIGQAFQAGAVAAVVEREVQLPGNMTRIKVADTRKAMQAIVPYFFGFPGRKLRMIGVTGTNGKTTTTYLLRDILRCAGYKVGVIGTIQTLIAERVLPVKNTTPDVVELQSILAQMVDADIDYVVMEVSSHALALNRIAGCEFDVGIFTNMTQDHLDFHGTFENYLKAKARLFQLLSSTDSLKAGKTAVVNLDDAAAGAILQSSHCPTITYAVKETAADLQAVRTDIRASGSSITVQGPFGHLDIKLQITGMFNVYNVLGAVGAALAEKVRPEIIQKALEQFKSVPGRFELVDEGQPYSVIVDYAHTPDGLENILKTAQQIAQRRIIVVFGCGGDRDRTKRPIMGGLAAEYGDVVLATSDNPRSEDPYAILDEIEVGIKNKLQSDKIYEKIPDRRQAIKRALELAQKDDIVVIAGKGHETYQILKDQTIHFDDREIARKYIREMIG